MPASISKPNESPGLALGRRGLSHLPLVLLLCAALGLAAQSVGVYMQTDDMIWLERTTADARQPWNIFRVAPLFGNYYRPVAHAVWLVNYSVWGFEFRGYQATMILLWLGAALLLYRAAGRMAGPLAAHVAFALFTFHYITLLLLRWKSWFTTVTESLFLFAFVCAFAAWRRRRDAPAAALAIVCGLAAAFSKELAALVAPTIVFCWHFAPKLRARKWTRRDSGWVCLLVAATLVLLFALPAYRDAAASLFRRASVSEGASPEISLRHVPPRFVLHARSMLCEGGVLRFLLLYLLLSELFVLVRARERLGSRTHAVFLGSYLVLAALVGLPPVEIGCLLLIGGVVLLGAIAGKEKLVCAAWFAVALMPILLSRYATRAYHVEAYAALSIYVGILCAETIRRDLRPVWRRIRREIPQPVDWWPRLARAWILCLLMAVQVWTLIHSGVGYLHIIRKQVAVGLRDRRRVLDCEAKATRRVMLDKQHEVVIYSGDMENLLATILRIRHGLSVSRPFRSGSRVIPLERLHRSLHVYARGLEVRRDDLAALNLLPPSGRALKHSDASARPPPRLKLAPGKRYAFGASLKAAGDFEQAAVLLELASVAPGAGASRHAWRTPDLRADHLRRYAHGWLFTARVFRAPAAGGIVQQISIVPSERRRVVVRDPFLLDVDALLAKQGRARP